MSRLIDLTHRIRNGIPVYPGDAGVHLSADSVHGFDKNGVPAAHVGRVNIGLHNGTHMDAPYHFLPRGFTIEETPLDRCIGPAVLVDLPGLEPRTEIKPDHFASFESELVGRKRVVIRTGWSSRWQQPDYFTAHPFVGLAGARWLLDRQVELLGLDFPSIDHPPFETHLLWLGAGASIVENLTNLDQITVPVFTLVALPLPFAGMDGSPVRAVARLDQDPGGPV